MPEKRVRDPEVAALAKMYELISAFDIDTRTRMLQWLLRKCASEGADGARLMTTAAAIVARGEDEEQLKDTPRP